MTWPIERDPVFGCHLWTGDTWPNGYPLHREGGESQSAHRVSYERVHGKIADGLVVDHLCRRVRCVNPEHLEAVTKQENERRKAMRHRLARRSCCRGHALNEVSRIVTPEMGVLCRLCVALQPPGPAGVAQG